MEYIDISGVEWLIAEPETESDRGEPKAKAIKITDGLKVFTTSFEWYKAIVLDKKLLSQWNIELSYNSDDGEYIIKFKGK